MRSGPPVSGLATTPQQTELAPVLAHGGAGSFCLILLCNAAGLPGHWRNHGRNGHLHSPVPQIRLESCRGIPGASGPVRGVTANVAHGDPPEFLQRRAGQTASLSE